MTQNEATSPLINSVPSPAVGESVALTPVIPEGVPDGIPIEFATAQQSRNEAGLGFYDDSQDIADYEVASEWKAKAITREPRTLSEEYHDKAEELFSRATDMNERFGLEPETVDLYEEAKNNFMSAYVEGPVNKKTRELETPDPLDLLKVAQSLLAMARDPRQPDWHDPEMKDVSDPILRTKTRAQILEQSAQRNLEHASEILMGVGSYATIAAGEFTDNDTREVFASAVVDALEETPTVENLVMGEIRANVKTAEDLKDEAPETIVDAIDVDLERSEDAAKYIARVTRNALEDLAPTVEHTVIL